MNKLVISYKFDPSYFDKKLPPDNFGRLSLIVETEKFKGKAGFWVQWQDVVEFGESLNQYPIKQDAPISVQWGFDNQEGDDLIIRLKILPRGSRGELTASIELADDYEPSQRLTVSFRTTYSAVELFRSDIAKLMKREIEEAVLLGH